MGAYVFYKNEGWEFVTSDPTQTKKQRSRVWDLKVSMISGLENISSAKDLVAYVNLGVNGALSGTNQQKPVKTPAIEDALLDLQEEGESNKGPETAPAIDTSTTAPAIEDAIDTSATAPVIDTKDSVYEDALLRIQKERNGESSNADILRDSVGTH